jgi:metallo-beta-lactamase family protein
MTQEPRTRLKMKFIGAAREVTGSKTQISYKNEKILIDCGLYQGDKELRQLNWEDIPHADNYSAVILTHAHIDHSGYLPRFVRQGFRGQIYCTPATAALLAILLADAAHLEEEDAAYANERGYSSHRPALPLFTMEDVERTLRLIKVVDRDKWVELCPGLGFRFVRSGHILGSSFVHLSFHNGEGPRTITFSGDLGSERSFIIKGPVYIKESDYLVLEGTYGDKVNRSDNIHKEMARMIKHVAARRGVLVIPAFAVGRTQELLYVINELVEQKLVPRLPLYLDSPMAIKATEIYSRFTDDLKLVEAGTRLETSMADSHFRGVTTAIESRRLTQLEGPFIVISAAGMLTGGRILHHLKARLPDPASAVLFVGYQAQGTKGRLLQNGIDKIRIHKQEVEVRAEIKTIEGFSAHADSREIVDWVRQFKRAPNKVFLNHGEREPLQALRYRLQNELGITGIEIPRLGEEFELD